MGDQQKHGVLNERAQQLLKTLVQLHIRDGQPVGSRTLSRDSNLTLSPATIRNVMSDLEEHGYIASPHTSAGRVPTDKGYRFFVDTLLKLAPLREGEIERLRVELTEHRENATVLVQKTSSLLSGITRLAGVVTVPLRKQQALRQIEFLPLSQNRVLTILVVNEREVQNRILHLDRSYSESELRAAANYLNEQFGGHDLGDVRTNLLKAMQTTRENMNRAMLDAIQMAQAVFDGADEDPPASFVLAGETNLMGFNELSSVDKLRNLFETFSRKRDILHLLDQVLGADGVQIFIGQESGYSQLEECSVVTAPYLVDDQVVGVLGVIGPTRMAYERVIPIVDITAKLLGSALKSKG